MTEAERKLLLFLGNAAKIEIGSLHGLIPLVKAVEAEQAANKVVDDVAASITNDCRTAIEKLDAQTATGTELDRLARRYGLQRRVGLVRFSNGVFGPEPDCEFRNRILIYLTPKPKQPAAVSVVQRYTWAPPSDFVGAPEPPFAECKWDNQRNCWVLFSNIHNNYVRMSARAHNHNVAV